MRSAIAGGLIAASTLLGKRAKSPLKDTPYESGMAPVGSARERFSVKFYMVGMIFILFDIEAVFLYPWAVVYRQLKLFGFFEMLIFVALILVGFFYVWKKGALDWARQKADEKRQGQVAIRRFSKPSKPLGETTIIVGPCAASSICAAIFKDDREIHPPQRGYRGRLASGRAAL